jgi:hypothetical protein
MLEDTTLRIKQKVHHQCCVHRYWVLGGEYASTGFDKILPGAEIVVVPLASHGLAEQS